MRTIKLPSCPTGHSAPLTHVALRADGQRLASSSYDGTALIWDISDPAKPQKLSRLQHRRLVNSAAWNPSVPELLATASADKTAGVWHIGYEGEDAELVNVLARHTDDINAVDWMPDGRRLICVSEDGRATMWDALSGSFLAEVGSHTAHCMAVSVSADGLVATVGEDGLVSLVRPGSDGESVTRRYDCSIEGCAWNHAGTVLAVARDDGHIDLLSRQLQPIRTWEVSDSAVRTVDWAEGDASLVIGAYDGSLHFFSFGGDRIHQIYDPRVWPRSVSVAGGIVAAGSFWNGPHLYSATDAKEISGPATANHGPNAMTVSEGELYIGCDSGAVLAVPVGAASAEGGSRVGQAAPVVRALEPAEGPVLSLTARDGVVFAGTYAGHAIAWRDGQRVVSDQLGAPLPSICVDGQTLVAGNYNGELVVFDPETLAVLDRRAVHDGSVKSLTMMTGGFLSAGTDRTVAAGTVRERSTLWEHGNLVNAVAALDGEVVASASRDHTVKAGQISSAGASGWRARTVHTLLGPNESVKCVGVLGTPDAPVVIAGSYDFGLYAWELDWYSGGRTLTSGRLLMEFAQGVSCIAQLDSQLAAVASWDGSVLIVGIDDQGAVAIRQRWRTDELAALAEVREEAVPR